MQPRVVGANVTGRLRLLRTAAPCIFRMLEGPRRSIVAAAPACVAGLGPLLPVRPGRRVARTRAIGPSRRSGTRSFARFRRRWYFARRRFGWPRLDRRRLGAAGAGWCCVSAPHGKRVARDCPARAGPARVGRTRQIGNVCRWSCGAGKFRVNPPRIGHVAQLVSDASGFSDGLCLVDGTDGVDGITGLVDGAQTAARTARRDLDNNLLDHGNGSRSKHLAHLVGVAPPNLPLRTLPGTPSFIKRFVCPNLDDLLDGADLLVGHLRRDLDKLLPLLDLRCQCIACHALDRGACDAHLVGIH